MTNQEIKHLLNDIEAGKDFELLRNNTWLPLSNYAVRDYSMNDLMKNQIRVKKKKVTKQVPFDKNTIPLDAWYFHEVKQDAYFKIVSVDSKGVAFSNAQSTYNYTYEYLKNSWKYVNNPQVNEEPKNCFITITEEEE
jgi:hypothetical protein